MQIPLTGENILNQGFGMLKDRITSELEGIAADLIERGDDGKARKLMVKLILKIDEKTGMVNIAATSKADLPAHEYGLAEATATSHGLYIESPGEVETRAA